MVGLRLVFTLLLMVMGVLHGSAATGEVKPDYILRPRWTGVMQSASGPVLEVYLSPDARRGFLSFERCELVQEEGQPLRWTSPIYPMWKARTGDLDGNGRDEVVLGIWSNVGRHAGLPLPHRAVWVMGWGDDGHGAKLFPLWQGSALSLPLLDFEVADVNGDGKSELLAMEGSDGACFWTVYRWNGFGFGSDTRRPVPCEAEPTPHSHCINYVEGQGQVTQCASLSNSPSKSSEQSNGGKSIR